MLLLTIFAFVFGIVSFYMRQTTMVTFGEMAVGTVSFIVMAIGVAAVIRYLSEKSGDV